MFWLQCLARWFAVVGGLLLVSITLVTCASVIGRNWLQLQLVGDFELTGALTGMAIASFLPWCQLTQGNIIVDFFTARSSNATRAALDRCGALAMSAAMALFAWRTALGGINAWNSHSSSMLLGLPDWWVYLVMVMPLALTAVIAFAQACAPRYAPVADTSHAKPGDGFAA